MKTIFSIFFFFSFLSLSRTILLSPCQKIFLYRKSIDFFDDRIANLIEIRLYLCRQVGKHKLYSFKDINRETHIIQRICDQHPHLSTRLIQSIWSTLFYESLSIQLCQNASMNDEKRYHDINDFYFI